MPGRGYVLDVCPKCHRQICRHLSGAFMHHKCSSTYTIEKRFADIEERLHNLEQHMPADHIEAHLDNARMRKIDECQLKIIRALIPLVMGGDS